MTRIRWSGDRFVWVQRTGFWCASSEVIGFLQNAQQKCRHNGTLKVIGGLATLRMAAQFTNDASILFDRHIDIAVLGYHTQCNEA